MVSTHSRPKAAVFILDFTIPKEWFQHTAARRRLLPAEWVYGGKKGFQHTAARRRLLSNIRSIQSNTKVSTHSRPKAAACALDFLTSWIVFQHTAARRRLSAVLMPSVAPSGFQHTAARRRLKTPNPKGAEKTVSTHSRPKAAVKFGDSHNFEKLFQHTAARRRLKTKTTISMP